MYDTIIVHDTLPLNKRLKELLKKTGHNQYFSYWSLQTKDLGERMSHFTLSEKRLFETVRDEDGLAFEMASMFTGTVTMYDFIERDDIDVDIWVEWRVRFKDGVQVGKVKLVQVKETPNAARREAERRLKLELEIWRNRWYNRYFFHTPILSKIRMTIWRVENHIINLFSKNADTK
jgi:hypothetical protein